MTLVWKSGFGLWGKLKNFYVKVGSEVVSKKLKFVEFPGKLI